MKNLMFAAAAAALLAVSGFSALPVNPDAMPEVGMVLDYLADVSAHNRILSGQESPFDMQYVRHIQRLTGKWPAIIGLDFYCEDTVSLRPGMIATAIEYWRAGGLVTICWHQHSPKESLPDAGGWESVRSSMSQDEFDQVVTPGTPLFERWAKNVDIIAAFLQELRDSGVIVLWRPYHEMNGSWFWWGGHRPSSFKRLWYNMYDRLTNRFGLNNLIWVWSPNNAVNAAYYLPEFVDVGGVDLYTSRRDDGRWRTQDATLSRILGDKPYSITECGLVPDPEYLRSLTGYSWFLVWAFGWCDNTAFGMPPGNGPGNRPEQLVELYLDPVCITRDELSMDPESIIDWPCLTMQPADLPNPFDPAVAAAGRAKAASRGQQVLAAADPRILGRGGCPWNGEQYASGISVVRVGNGKSARSRKQVHAHVHA